MFRNIVKCLLIVHCLLYCPIATVQAIDNPPAFSNASLATSVVYPGMKYFGGTVSDDIGLASIAMIVSGPKVNNYTAFTDTSVNGLKSKALSAYYFNSNDSNYSGLGGTYTLFLRATDSSGNKKDSSSFTITVTDNAPVLNLTAETWNGPPGTRTGISQSTFPYNGDVALWLRVQNSGRRVNTYMTLNDPANGTRYCYYSDNTLPTGSENPPKALFFSSSRRAMFSSSWTVVAGDYLINRYIYKTTDASGQRTFTYWYEDADTGAKISEDAVSFTVEAQTAAPTLDLTSETWTGTRTGISQSTFPYNGDVALWLRVQNSVRRVNTYMTLSDPTNGTRYCYYSDDHLPFGYEDPPKRLSFNTNKKPMFTSAWTVEAGDYLINRYVYSATDTLGPRTFTYWYEDADTGERISEDTVTFTIEDQPDAPTLDLTAETWNGPPGTRTGISQSTFPYNGDVALWLRIQNSGRRVNTYMTLSDPTNGTRYCYYSDDHLPSGYEDPPKRLTFISTKQAMFTSVWTVEAGDWLINRYVYSAIDTPGPRTFTYWYEDADTGERISQDTVSFTVQAQVLSASPVFTPLYRLYKSNDPAPNFKDHFYTINWAERVSAESESGYTFERIEGYVSKIPFAAGIPLYRLRNTGDSSHFYTTDETERTAKMASGYVEDGDGITGIPGVEGYVYADYADGLVPLYRLHQTKDAPTHYFLCIRKQEYDNALSMPAWGFEDEGIIAYVSPDGLVDPLAHRRPQANFGGADLGTGAYRGLNSLDLLMKGRGPDLVFAHYYNSFNFAEYPMGPGWSHNLDSFIIEEVVPIEAQASEKPNIYVKWGDGSGSAFESTGPEADEYKDLTGNHDLLTRIDDDVNYGYDLTKKDQTVYEYRRLSINPPPEVAAFCSANPENVFCNKIVLIRIRDWAGNALTFEYDAAAAYLLAVRDDMGRRLELDYHVPSNLLKSVTEKVAGTEKRTVSFGYNAEGLLESFTDANGEITRYSYYNWVRLF